MIELPESKPKTRSVRTVYQPQPEPDYMEKVRSAHPASEDPVERSKRIQEGLAAILGPERMSLSVGSASGHSGISDDPILKQYNEDKKAQNTLNLREQYNTLVRQQREEYERSQAEHNADMERKKIQLDVARYNYMDRVCKLAQLGPKFNAEIMKLQQTFTNGDLGGLQWAVHNLINNILEPSNKIFEDMKEQIVLEQQGTETLKEAWPLEAVDQILRVFDAQTLWQFDENTHNALGCMLQCMRAVCQPILVAKPFINPLDQASANLPFVAAPVPLTFAQFAASMGAVVPQQPYQQ
jgi:hypothetical protein